jgi:hypothetical protein
MYNYIASFTLSGKRFVSVVITSTIHPEHITKKDIAACLEKLYAIKLHNFEYLTYEVSTKT